VIIGRTLRMTCHLYSSRYHAKRLRFEFRLYRKRRITVEPSDVRIVNASVAELSYTNMKSRFDRATVVCYHRNRPDTVRAMQIIKVGREWFSFAVCAIVFIVQVLQARLLLVVFFDLPSFSVWLSFTRFFDTCHPRHCIKTECSAS